MSVVPPIPLSKLQNYLNIGKCLRNALHLPVKKMRQSNVD